MVIYAFLLNFVPHLYLVRYKKLCGTRNLRS